MLEYDSQTRRNPLLLLRAMGLELIQHIMKVCFTSGDSAYGVSLILSWPAHRRTGGKILYSVCPSSEYAIGLGQDRIQS